MRTAATRVLLTSAFLLVPLAGCEKQEAASPGAAAEPGVLPTDMGSTIGEAVSETTDALAGTYASQLDQQESQVTSLKASAQTVADDKLNQLISAIDSKLAAARQKLDEIKNADQGSAQALGNELKSLMSELQKLYQQALERVAELKKP
jgi:chromosome segregation ATPase